MTIRKTQIVILCEDKQHWVFARKYLEAKGINKRKMTPVICADGQQSGEQFVRERFAEEVRTFRRKQRENRALVLVTDADTHLVAERIEQLEQQLEKVNLPRRGGSERIAIFVPKRNIETWIAFARGETVDEITSYRKLENESDCVPLVHHLARNVCPTGLSVDAPQSLHIACNELKRIL